MGVTTQPTKYQGGFFVSGHETDQSYILNLPLTSESVQPTEPARLSDLSERDRVWDEHRTNSDKIANHYKGTEFDNYAKRIYFCSELLDFKLTPDIEEGLLKLKHTKLFQEW